MIPPSTSDHSVPSSVLLNSTVHNTKFSTVGLLNSPWSSPKKIVYENSEVVSRPEFAQDHESGLRSDRRGPVVLCDFSKLRFLKSPYDFLNLYRRFCPYNPPYKPGKKICTPPFLVDENIFQKSASVVVGGIAVEL
jgi:hypothetical protein